MLMDDHEVPITNDNMILHRQSSERHRCKQTPKAEQPQTKFGMGFLNIFCMHWNLVNQA